jgi:hypothetical protein
LDEAQPGIAALLAVSCVAQHTVVADLTGCMAPDENNVLVQLGS